MQAIPKALWDLTHLRGRIARRRRWPILGCYAVMLLASVASTLCVGAPSRAPERQTPSSMSCPVVACVPSESAPSAGALSRRPRPCPAHAARRLPRPVEGGRCRSPCRPRVGPRGLWPAHAASTPGRLPATREACGRCSWRGSHSASGSGPREASGEGRRGAPREGSLTRAAKPALHAREASGEGR